MRAEIRRGASLLARGGSVYGGGGATLWRPTGNAHQTRWRSLNYRHAFHAGNFGDVLKHSVLVATLRHMHRKDKPMFLLDTHASRGVFELTSPEAARSPEHLHGALRPRKLGTPHALHDLAVIHEVLSRACRRCG